MENNTRVKKPKHYKYKFTHLLTSATLSFTSTTEQDAFITMGKMVTSLADWRFKKYKS